MKEKFLQIFSINSKISKMLSKYTVFLVVIIGITLSIRYYFFPIDIPLSADALYYFWYSVDIYHIGKLPVEWTPLNNGWPIFVSIFFTIFDSKDIFTLMQIQKVVSVLISVSITIPVYFICKKFVARKFAIIGSSFIAFDPRLIINSFLGVSDPLYLLLIATSLALFLSINKKLIYFSFVMVSFATIVRAEGFVFFLVLSVMFLIRYRKEKYNVFLKYLIMFGIFMLVALPISLYRIEVIDDDGIFMNNLGSGKNLVLSLTSSNNSNNGTINGLELFIKYLIWVMIPNFIIFIPLGLLLIFRNRNFEKNTIIVSLCMMSVPALYTYMNNALDTRYLYTLFPMFSVLSVLSIEKISDKLNQENILVIVIIIGIIVSSTIFYNQQKIDYEHEKESFEIMKKISSMVNGINALYQESDYFKTSQTIEQWPNMYTKMGLGTEFKVITIPTNNFNSLKNYIIESKNKGLTHIMVDNKKERRDFLVELFNNENNYPYLKKIYDSKSDGYVYHVKVFKIDYELFDSFKK